MTIEQFKLLMPLACAWAEEQEQLILRTGVPLTSAEIADATAIGVSHSEKVRLLKVPGIPVPQNSHLRQAAHETHLISPETRGMSIRYGIFIRADCWRNRQLVFHELVHTMQYERMKGIQPFLQQYLLECITVGYPDAPMEQEAIITTLEKCV